MPFSTKALQETTTNIVGDTTSTAVDANDASSLVISSTIAVATPSAGTSAAANWNTSDIITITAHNFVTGVVGQVTTSGVLPTGISGATNYFVYVISANTFYLYDTLANALVGGATGRVNITNVGSGNHTFTPTALAGGSTKLQGLVAPSTWVTIPDTTQSVTGAATFVWELDYVRYPEIRAFTTLTAGVLTANIDAQVKTGE